MYTTIWAIHDETDEGTTTTQLVYYHFGKTPQFPSWYMKEDHTYSIELAFNYKLVRRIDLFFKCLTRYHRIIKNRA